jgi:hypothetical protein
VEVNSAPRRMRRGEGSTDGLGHEDESG